MKHKNIIIIAAATGLLLLIPLVAMQFTDEVVWSVSDFIIMGILLLGSGLLYEFIASRGSTLIFKAAAALAVGTGLLLIWSNMAVGLIGDEGNPANLLYLGVIAIALAGSFAARFRAEGMMRTLFTAAAAQALVPFIAMAIWKPPFDSGLVNTLGANAFFVVLWAGAALLFRRAGNNKGSQKKEELQRA